MGTIGHARTFLLATCLAGALSSSCADEDPKAHAAHHARADAGASLLPAGDAAVDGSTVPSQALAACVPARSLETIPARTVASSSAARAGDKVVYVSELFGLFTTHCGGCHAGLASQGGFNVPVEGSFARAPLAKMIARIRTDDLTQLMPRPPQGIPMSMRNPGDSVLQLATWLELYMNQKTPADSFIVPATAPATSTAGASGYALTAETGAQLTNIGSCIPAPAVVGRNTDKMRELDQRFAQLKRLPPGMGTATERVGLPERLDQTDLFTLDTEELAHHGVIAYAPGYPLWSDGARKLRHVRVPLGQSIRFDPATQSFDIPENTRFYKTFLKQVRELSGEVRWRKVETRLIVARHDREHGNADGTNQFTALFGTYEWNEDETAATLHTLPQRNGEPFADHLFPVVIDEIKQQEVLATRPKKPSASLLRAQAMRTYAVPSLDRCVQCHIGSPTRDFVLGFFPLQINRLPAGEEGVIEPSGPDELTQLQRMIDYGVVSGLTSPAEVTRLSHSQGARAPRNAFELAAQGYLLGNCAHCHNPRGYTTVNNPLLAGVLDFLPSAEGGIFQFDLQKTSPRIFNGSTPIPYITPSLYNYPDNPKGVSLDTYGTPASSIPAPWRSLIYRNVDTPFTYPDGAALYPHMPMNVPGFDCRAPRLLGDWMVSIPARRKSTNAPEDRRCSADNQSQGDNPCDFNPQPYVEARPSDPDYPQAVVGAERRLLDYHQGISYSPVDPLPVSRYAYCADTTDIVDPFVTGEDGKRVPASGNTDTAVLNADGSTAMDIDRVPNHPHWVKTDTTDPPPPWFARGSNWEKVLVQHDLGLPPAASETLKLEAWLFEKRSVETLIPTNGDPPMALGAEIRRFAEHPIPMGLWDESDPAHACPTFVPTVGRFPLETSRWKKANPSGKGLVRVQPSDRVYAELPGQAIYNMICINCHGANFDSRGRLADTLMLVTGGSARVANFSTGLFGDAGAVRQSTFLPAAQASGGTVDDWAARYLAWMGLGGTKAGIPGTIMSLVSNTPVLGKSRHGELPPPGETANMLAVARNLCADVLPLPDRPFPMAKFDLQAGWLDPAWNDIENKPISNGTEYVPSLIRDNGDAELWLRLCAVDNPAPVREISVRLLTGGVAPITTSTMYAAKSYPSASQVGDIRATVRSTLSPDNLFPWCLKDQADTRAYLADKGIPVQSVAFCPVGLTPMTPEQQDTWVTRGAINAGFSVFIFLDKVSKGMKPKPDYTRCDLETPSP